MEPIRILHVFISLDIGGAESMIMNYYRHIDKKKIQFDFIKHTEKKGAFEDEIRSLGGNIYSLPKLSLKKINKYNFELDKFFRISDYKIIHSHINAFSKIILKKAKKYNIPVRIAHSHTASSKLSLNFFNSHFKLKDQLKILLKNIIKYKITEYSTHNFACSNNAGEWLFGKERSENVIIINNSIDANSFEYDKEISLNNKRKLKLKNKLVIIHVGRFSSEKNHNFLIDVFALIKKKHKESVLILIGDGLLKKDIQTKVEELNINSSVLFLGVQNNIPFFLSAADIFLFPSIYEGLPLTLIEAQASGLKSIVSDNVSNESKITDLVEFISLKMSTDLWADRVLKYKDGYSRRSTLNIINHKGYNIHKNAIFLQEFYLNQKI
jgi:glycosyltransferase involved in cell wall biosynthesis